jgi:hypothetical protein
VFDKVCELGFPDCVKPIFEDMGLGTINRIFLSESLQSTLLTVLKALFETPQHKSGLFGKSRSIMDSEGMSCRFDTGESFSKFSCVIE